MLLRFASNGGRNLRMTYGTSAVAWGYPSRERLGTVDLLFVLAAAVATIASIAAAFLRVVVAAFLRAAAFLLAAIGTVLAGYGGFLDDTA